MANGDQLASGCAGIGVGFTLCIVVLLGGCVYAVKSCVEAPAKLAQEIGSQVREAGKSIDQAKEGRYEHIKAGMLGMSTSAYVKLSDILKRQNMPPVADPCFLCTEDELMTILSDLSGTSFRDAFIDTYKPSERKILLCGKVVDFGTWDSQAYISCISEGGKKFELYGMTEGDVKDGDDIVAVGSLREEGNEFVSWKFKKCTVLTVKR